MSSNSTDSKAETGIVHQKGWGESEAEIFFWFGTCYGACDTPLIEKAGFDLFIQFGHSQWKG